MYSTVVQQDFELLKKVLTLPPSHEKQPSKKTYKEVPLKYQSTSYQLNV